MPNIPSILNLPQDDEGGRNTAKAIDLAMPARRVTADRKIVRSKVHRRGQT
jgi:hypothetical protein